MNAGFTREGVIFTIDIGPDRTDQPRHYSSFRLTLVGSMDTVPVGSRPLPHLCNFFIGKDPDGWQRGVRTFQEVLYEGILEGVDLKFRMHEGIIKYDVVLAPGLDPSGIEMMYHGVDHLSLDETTGDLKVHTELGTVVDSRPIFEQRNGIESIPGTFVLKGEGKIGFDCPRTLDPGQPTVIDPGLVFSTYIGGSGDDHVAGSKVDSQGRTYIIGATKSPDFPVTPNAAEDEWNLNQGTGYDGYVALVSSDGSTLIGCTYVGGEDDDVFADLVLFPSGELAIVGWTSSEQFPTINNSLDNTYNEGQRDACMCRLSSDLSDLYYGSFFGGSGYDGQMVMDMAADNSIYMAGVTTSTDLPTTTDAYQRSLASTGGFMDSFAVHLSASMRELYYCTYMGGSGTDRTPECVVDDNGSLYVSVWTDSTDLETSNGCFQDSNRGGEYDGYIYQLSPNGTELLASTYLGGDALDVIADVLLDNKGKLYICGATTSTDYPSTLDTPFPDRIGDPSLEDSFITVLDPQLSRVLTSTFLGGDRTDLGYDLAITEDGDRLAFIGVTTSANINTTNGSFDNYRWGPASLFLYVMNTTSWDVEYCTYMGGSNTDECLLPARVLSFSPDGALHFGLETSSRDFPTTSDAFARKHAGGEFDAAVVRLVPEECPRGPAPNVSVVSGDLYVNLSWDLTPYECTRIKLVNVYRGMSDAGPDGGPRRLAPDATSFNDTAGLVYGKTFYYWVSVVTNAGESERRGPIGVWIIGRPVADINITASSGDGNVMLEWNGTIDWRGGVELTELRVLRGPDEQNLTTIAENVSGDRTTFYDDDGLLEDGVEYHYALQPYNEEYDGDLVHTSVLVFSPPSRPTDLHGSPGNGTVELSWKAPLADGGNGIDGYQVERREGGGDWYRISDLPASNTTLTDGAVTNNVTYSYRVRAYNAFVNGSFSAPIEVKPFGLPSAPVNVINNTENGTISIHWDRPLVDWGEDVLQYTIYWGEDPEHLVAWATTPDYDWVSRNHTLNVTYYFRLTATNLQGEGPPTTLFEVMTLMRPGAPTNVQVTNGTNRSLVVSWDPPVDNGGASPLEYIVTRWTTTSSRTEVNRTLTTRFEDTDLKGGENYFYTVRAYNGRYDSLESDAVDITFVITPGPPSIFEIVQTSEDTLVLKWEAPDDDGGPDVVEYKVRRTVTGVVEALTFEGIENTTLTDGKDILANTTYNYMVAARNPLGWGEWSAP